MLKVTELEVHLIPVGRFQNSFNPRSSVVKMGFSFIPMLDVPIFQNLVSLMNDAETNMFVHKSVHLRIALLRYNSYNVLFKSPFKTTVE